MLEEQVGWQAGRLYDVKQPVQAWRFDTDNADELVLRFQQ